MVVKARPDHLIKVGIVGGAIFSAIAVAGLIWQNYYTAPLVPGTETKVSEDNNTDPLRWDFLAEKQTNFLMGKTTDYGVEIHGFQAIGKNETGHFIKGLSGHVESVRNGKTYPLKFVDHNQLSPLSGYGVPGGNQFMVRAPFFEGAGIPVVQFLSEFGALIFVFEYNGTTYTHHISEEQVQAQAQWLEQELKPKPRKSEAGGVPLADAEPRRLSDEQKGLIAEVLKDSNWEPGSIWIRYFNTCEECRLYATDLREALTLAGWNGDFGQTGDQREDIVGLKLNVVDLNAKPRTAAVLALALGRASINFEWQPWPEIEKDHTILFVYPRD
jgi:hypothetical protein